MKFFNKTIAVFLTFVMIFGLFPASLFAQTDPSSSLFEEIKGLNRSVFDSHFSRADRELSPELWLAEARLGVTQAICAWEMFAANLYENQIFFEEAKVRLEKWSNEELEERFSRWLMGRFFGEAARKALTEFTAMFDETQKKYSWHLDDEGNVIFDTKTGDPLIIRPGDENREFSEDLLQWRDDVKNIVIKNSASFESVINGLYPELLAYVPEGLRESMFDVIRKSGNAVNAAIKREFENIAVREEGIFTSRRTRDIWSLRKKSDDEAARIFTERLIAETEESCAKGIEELTSKIEEASAGTGDLAILGEEWLQLYREQFERGLKAWEEAEERFFIRRVEWEQDSFKLFSEGEETWLASFNQFEEERKKWELNAKSLFQSGEQLFINISETFEKNIADAKKEFEANLAMRTEAGTTQAKALVDMYLICASAAMSTKENILFWLKDYDPNIDKDPADPNLPDWLSEERMRFWAEVKNNYKYSSTYFSDTLQLDSLKETLDDAITSLGEYSENKQTLILEKENAETAYFDYLDYFNNKHSILFYIDEIIKGEMTLAEELAYAEEYKNHFPYGYDYNFTKYNTLVEVQKSYDLYASYMEKSLDARERILANYAEIIGAGALKDILAKDASSEDFCLDEYQLALIRAKTLVLYWERKANIADAVTAYAVEFAAGRMTEGESIRLWENAKSSYNEALALYETELTKLNNLGVELSTQQKTLGVLANRMTEAEEELNNINKEYSAIVAASIVNSANASLTNLKWAYNIIISEYKYFLETGADAAFVKFLETGLKWDIAEQKENTRQILEYLINGKENEVSSLSELKEAVLNGSASEVELKIRLAAIDLFKDIDPNYSGADWYSKAKGISLTKEKRAALYGENLLAALAADYRKSSQTLFEKRLDFELDALFNFLDEDWQNTSNDEDSPKEYINPTSEFCLVDIETADFAYNTLVSMKGRLDANGGYYTEDSDENKLINFFINGGSFFSVAEQYLSEYIDDYSFCMNLLDLYDTYHKSSFFIQKELWQNTCDYLSAFFIEYDLVQEENFLPDVESIYNSILEISGDFAENAAQFLKNFDNCLIYTPEWMENELDNWKNALIEYIAANALHSGIAPSKNMDMLYYEQYDLNQRFETLNTYAASLSSISDYELEMFSDLQNENILLSYLFQITGYWEYFNNETAGAKNKNYWRQYLYQEHFENYDPVLANASSWNEGVMQDSLFKAGYFSARLNYSFSIMANKETFATDEEAQSLYNLFKYEDSAATNRFYSLLNRFSEFKNLGKSYEISKMSLAEAKEQLGVIYAKLAAQESLYTALRDNYFLEAENFLNIGTLYDTQYSLLKKIYDDTDQKRYEYEKQDAIRRWASTAYLDSGSIDKDNSRDKLAKAQIVLNILSDIYSDEKKRTYDDPEYNELYSKYEKSFNRKLTVLNALETLSSEIAQEKQDNYNLFSKFQNNLSMLGPVAQDYSEYTLPESKDDWEIKNIITVENGRLKFSKDASMTISGIDENQANTLGYFFNNRKIPDNEIYDLSQFDVSLTALSQRMSGYLVTEDDFMNWSLAREYFITLLVDANKDLKFLETYKTGLGYMDKDASIGRVLIQEDPIKTKSLYTYAKETSYYKSLKNKTKEAWDNLSAEAKADLEYYIILSLSGNGYHAGFPHLYIKPLYDKVDKMVNDKYRYARKKTEETWNLLAFWAFFGMRDVNNDAKNRIKGTISEINSSTDGWKRGLKNNISSIASIRSAYLASCEKITKLEGKKENGQSIVWNDIKDTLLASKKISETDIAILNECWNEMQEKSNYSFQDVSNALTCLSGWARDNENETRRNLENKWYVSMQNQQKNENDYREAEEAFIAGTISVKALEAAAKKAYSENSASWRYHYEKLHESMASDLSLYLDVNNNYYSEFNVLGNELTALTENILTGRYIAELEAREIEWDQMRKDISDKYQEWQNSAGQILEKGREDWSAGTAKLADAYKQWNENFQKEYNRVSEEWALAYLAGLEDKEKWLELAEDAVNHASSEAFLSLVGAEGERLSRFVDVREPFGIRDAVPEAKTLMTELLNASGIINMSSTFASINNITGTISTNVKRGLGGVSMWNAALTKTAASDLARKTNDEIADREARRLARSASITIEETIDRLRKNVDSANDGFRESMDKMFVFNGLWKNNGGNYVKDVLTGSTLIDPIITKKVTITGYQKYIMQPVSFQAEWSENELANLNSIAINALLENLEVEVKALSNEIFGIGKESERIRKGKWDEDEKNKRLQSPGLFGAHIGYEPAVKDNRKNTKRSSVFNDEGDGELGRLLSDYIYWSIIEAQGNSELGMPAWDKRIWDDTGSWFEAPSLRSVGQIVGTVAGAIISAGVTGGLSLAGLAGVVALNSASDITFNTLDAVFGYKTFDEAAFGIGKSILMNTATSFISGGFNGIAGVTDGITNTAAAAAVTRGTASTVITKTMMAGAQTFTTGFATSIINGFTYNSKDGLGYSGEIVQSGIKGALTNALTSMVSTFTTSSLQAINSGINLEKLEGFNKLNKKDLENLNNLLGSLAGQGVNYAMGNDFTLNVLNLSFLTDNKHSSGLLELHLNRDGAKMNFGTGGANVSVDNLLSALKGAMVWDVNNRIDNFTKKNSFKEKETLRALYGYGDDRQTGELWNILKKDTIIRTDAEGDRSAKTTIDEETGKRVINLSGYKQNMSIEDQMRLAAILGHEAYRDGYVTGEIDSSGNLVTAESSFAELREASIARLAMGDRINQDYKWFYTVNEGFAEERFFLEMSIKEENPSLYDWYLENTYNNDNDYFFLNVSTNGIFQNTSRFKDIPLFASDSREKVNEKNKQNLLQAYEKYKAGLPENKKGSPLSYKEFTEDENLLKENGYKAKNFISIRDYGCMFLSLRNMLHTITGFNFDPLLLHTYIYENNLYIEQNLLSRELLAEVANRFLGNSISVELFKNEKKLGIVAVLNEFEKSDDAYIIHLRIKKDKDDTVGSHSVMVSNIVFDYDEYNHVIGIKQFNVANTWDGTGGSYLSKKSYVMSEIARYDIYKVTYNIPKYQSAYNNSRVETLKNNSF